MRPDAPSPLLPRAPFATVVGVCIAVALHTLPTFVGAQAPAAVLETVRLEADAASRPLGIDDRAPRLTWALASARRGVLQTAYRVLVATRPELLSDGRADVWDSGRRVTGDPWVTYAGPALRPRTRYWWTVRTWATPGLVSGWAAPAWFETGLLDARDWHGHWIAGPERALTLTPAEGLADDARMRAAGEFCRPVAWPTVPIMKFQPNDQGECRELRPTPMLRTAFIITKPVVRARAYASGLGYHLLTINGRPASDRVLDPQFTNYSKTVLYTTEDVTGLLRVGENVIASELGSGKFDDAARTWDWGWDRAEWRATPRLRLDLVVTYADGTEQIVASDTSWRVSTDGPTRYDSYYLGETYDARRDVAGWNRPGFDATRWPNARLVAPPAGMVRAEVAEPSRVTATLGPGRRSEPVPGVVVYDVGQDVSGWATIRVHAPAGTAVEVFYSEKRDSTGRASTDGNALVGGQLQTDYYVARGDEDEVWAPRFTYKGFRYVQLSGPGGVPLPAGVTASVDSVQQVRIGFAPTAMFASGNTLVDRVHASTRRALESNAVSGIFTDTPIYEKNPWTGDAQLSSGIASTLFDTRRLYTKQFQDMRDAQTSDGEVPLLAPSNRNYGYVGKPAFKPDSCCGATPAWDAFWFVVPWEAWQRFGDRRTLEATYPAMQRYLDRWIPRWTGRDGDAYAHTLTSGLGDWDAPTGVDPITGLTSTAYYAHFAHISAEAARVLGRSRDARRYDALFAQIRTEFNAKYLTRDGVYRDTTIRSTAGGFPAAVPLVPPVRGALQQSAQVLPLAFGLVPDALRPRLAARLADDVAHTRHGHEFVGIVGARYLLPVLTEAGYADAAYAVATQTTYPSYGYWADSLGWSALGEYWEPTSRSRNHHMFGSVAQWFYEDLAGVRPLAPGYARIAFRPAVPAGLDSAAATVESVRGTVAAAWRRTAGGLALDITVPPNATGVVYVPAARPADVVEVGGGAVVPAARAPGVHLVRTEGGRVVYAVGSGRYAFRVTPLPPHAPSVGGGRQP